MSDPFLIPSARIKRAGETAAYTVDFKEWLRSYWQKSTAYTSGSYVRAPSVSGFAYLALNAGETATREPPWPVVIGGTVQDGSIVWQATTPGINGFDPILGASWSTIAPPDGTLTIANTVETEEQASAQIGGGTQGSVYRVQCAVTTVGGNIYPVQFDLEIA